MLEYKTYSTSKTKKQLIIFLHGYNDSIANYAQFAIQLCEKIKDSLVVLPASPEVCDKNPKQRQWFGLSRHDPNNLRTNPKTSIPMIFKIYRQTEKNIDTCAKEINNFIDKMQQKYNIPNTHTYLIGFSQGAMLAIYTALSRKERIGGAFILSGLVAGRDLLSKKISSRPSLYLFHGKKDLKVQYKTLKSTVVWLKHRLIPTSVFTYDDLSHHITEQELNTVIDIITSHHT